MKNPVNWTKKELYEHLQHAVDVEFWTIPLYLTALYSIKGLKTQRKENYPDAAKLIQSVVIQEMLHLEIVANICNALGYSFLLELNNSFNSEGEGKTNEFWNNMFALSNSIMAVGEKGARPMFSSF
ncbi:MAG: ferritin-like domain-containing protein [Bacteroidota bacterium]